MQVLNQLNKCWIDVAWRLKIWMKYCYWMNKTQQLIRNLLCISMYHILPSKAKSSKKDGGRIHRWDIKTESVPSKNIPCSCLKNKTSGIHSAHPRLHVPGEWNICLRIEKGSVCCWVTVFPIRQVFTFLNLVTIAGEKNAFMLLKRLAVRMHKKPTMSEQSRRNQNAFLCLV